MMPFYSTEPGSRDFVVDANTYMTHKMGAGTRRMLDRIWSRNVVVALYDHLAAADPTFDETDADFARAATLYREAAELSLGWRYGDAYQKALEGLAAADAYFTARGNPDRLHTDWDAPVAAFAPAEEGLQLSPAVLDRELGKLSGL